MITSDEALDLVVRHAETLRSVARPIAESCGHVLAEDVVADGNGKRFAVHVRDESNEIRICDVATQKVLRTVKVNGQPRCLRFSADGSLFLVGVSDGTAITWDIAGI